MKHNKLHISQKNSIILLIAFMSIALFGIISVQIRWINNALKLKEEAMNRVVDEVLYNVVQRYDNENKLRLLTPQKFPQSNDTMIYHFQFKQSTGSSSPKPLVTVSQSATIHSRSSKVPPPPAVEEKTVIQSNDSLIYIISGDTVTVDLRNEKSNLEYLTQQAKLDIQKAQLELVKVEQMHVQQQKQFEVFVQRWNQEFVFQDVMQRINPKVLKTIIQNELKNRGIDHKFEFGIQAADSMVYISSNQASKQLKQTTHRTNLFPNDIFQRNNELLLTFTDNRSKMLANFSGLLALSGLFTLTILFLFTYSILLILRQKKLSDMKSDFINNMTHEFKTPLATISLAADSIENPKIINNSDKIGYFTQMIKKENRRMNSQVERILQVARLERKDLNLNYELLDLHSVINSCIETFKLKIENAGGEILFQPDAERSYIEMDHEHIFNVVKNLVDNAIKYTENNLYVKIKTWNFDKGICFSVEDHGIGMSKKVLSKIFEKFYREQHGNVHNVKGHGLGLSYSRQIIQLHNGEISAESQPGNGSTFTVFLPFSV